MKIAEDSPKANSSAGLTEVSYTIILSDRPLAKRFSVKNGAPVKLSGDAVLTAGIAARRTARGSPTEMLAAFGGDLERMGSSNVLVLAAPPPGHDRWPVVTRDGLDSSPGAIARTDEYFHARPGPGIGGLDHDVRDFPPHVMARLLLSSDDVDKAIADALAAACPQLSEAASLVRRSASTGVRARLTGVETDPNGGLHRFYVANEATGYAGFVASLAERLMLNGWLWGSISKNGTVLFRTLIDVGASKNLGRLWYEGPVILESDQLEYVPERRRPTITPGTFFRSTRQSVSAWMQ